MNARLSGSSEAAFFLDATPASRVDNRIPPVASAPDLRACFSELGPVRLALTRL